MLGRSYLLKLNLRLAHAADRVFRGVRSVDPLLDAVVGAEQRRGRCIGTEWVIRAEVGQPLSSIKAFVMYMQAPWTEVAPLVEAALPETEAALVVLEIVSRQTWTRLAAVGGQRAGGKEGRPPDSRLTQKELREALWRGGNTGPTAL